MRNINYKLSFLIVLIVSLVSSGLLFAGQSPKQDSATKQPAAATSDNAKTEAATAAVNQMIDKIIAKENALGQAMRNMHPLVETYVQSLDKDDELALTDAAAWGSGYPAPAIGRPGGSRLPDDRGRGCGPSVCRVGRRSSRSARCVGALLR